MAGTDIMRFVQLTIDPMQITRRLEFDAGHRIPDHQSQCRHLHGHRYAIEITLAGDDHRRRRRSGKRHGDGLLARQATGQAARRRRLGPRLPRLPRRYGRGRLPRRACPDHKTVAARRRADRRKSGPHRLRAHSIRSIATPTATSSGWNASASTKRRTAGPTPTGPISRNAGRIRPRSEQRKRGRVVKCTGLENRRWATVREFESHRFRQDKQQTLETSRILPLL